GDHGREVAGRREVREVLVEEGVLAVVTGRPGADPVKEVVGEQRGGHAPEPTPRVCTEECDDGVPSFVHRTGPAHSCPQFWGSFPQDLASVGTSYYSVHMFDNGVATAAGGAGGGAVE